MNLSINKTVINLLAEGYNHGVGAKRQLTNGHFEKIIENGLSSFPYLILRVSSLVFSEILIPSPWLLCGNLDKWLTGFQTIDSLR